jgi:hypothetical protein
MSLQRGVVPFQKIPFQQRDKEKNDLAQLHLSMRKFFTFLSKIYIFMAAKNAHL